jgi:mannobiose 2-epimerase
LIAVSRILLNRARHFFAPDPAVLSVLRGDACPPTAETYRRLAVTFDDYLRNDFLTCWFPRIVDRQNGGFHQEFGPDWKPGPETPRLAPHQARQTWLAACASLHDPGCAEQYREYALHGLDYLLGPMWDEQAGGPFFFLTPDGRPETDRGTEKHVYGATFVVFAAVAVYEALRDERARELARRTFEWIDAHAHDDDNEGYFEALARDGSPLLDPPESGRYDAIGTPYGNKSLNTHIHVLEALTALYRIAPSEHLRNRTEEAVRVVRDRMTVEPGAVHFFFTLDWRPLPMHDSFGHAVEAAYLLFDALQALGRNDDAETLNVARSLVDHALDRGWDTKHGGLWFAGQAAGPPLDRTKSWWMQAENWNSLLLMHELYRDDTDRYWRAFLLQSEFIFRHIVDRRNGGWRSRVQENGASVSKDEERKSFDWKAGYHDGRAIMNVIRRMRRLSEGAQ